MKRLILLPIISFLFACSVNKSAYSQTTSSSSNDCSDRWQLWSAKPGVEGAFPDTQVSYFRYTFEVPQDRKIFFRVTARYPLGRYMGFNIYNTSKMDSVAGISDVEINPDAGFENPYRTGESSDSQRYTLIMNPHDPMISQNNAASALTSDEGGPNPDAEKKLQQREVWYRIYDPTDGTGGSGQVELPRVEAIDQTTGEPVECPMSAMIPVPKGELNWGRLWSAPPGPDGSGDLHFVHHQGMGLYANRDTNYLAARLKLLGADKEVVVLKFKAPRTVKSINDLKNPENIDVRYWSFCIGGAVTTVTAECLADRNAKVDANGFINIVIAPEKMRSLAGDANFMVRPVGFIPVLIYRNLIASNDFEGSFDRVPLWRSKLSSTDGTDSYAAEKYIGSYAPVGRVCSIEQFEKDRCPL
jgi:hypothetical protein